jgi:hypothetical protein
MAVKRAEWAVLRGPVIAFALCATCAALVVSASHYFQQNMLREYRDHHARFRQASEQYLAVDDEERIIADFYPHFAELYAHGLLGRERRLSWLETLRETGAQLHLPLLNYKLDAQREVVPPAAMSLGNYALRASDMSLELGLLHEGDLVALLGALDAHARGHYSVRDCSLKRQSEDAQRDGVTANIAATCTLEWWTLDLRERKLEL